MRCSWCCSQKVRQINLVLALVFYKEIYTVTLRHTIHLIQNLYGTHVCKHCEDHAMYTDMNAAQEQSNSTPCAAGQKHTHCQVLHYQV